jgi:hypothetical protein
MPVRIRKRDIFRTAAVRGSALPWVLLLLALIGAACWWYFAGDSLPGPIRAIVPASPRAAPLLYKWRDAKGGLHVTDQPPADRPYETVRYDPNVNVVPSVVPAPPAGQ